MTFQIHLRRKDGTVSVNFKLASNQTPIVGEVIECSSHDQIVKAKVTGVRKTSVGADIGQPLDIVDADEV